MRRDIPAERHRAFARLLKVCVLAAGLAMSSSAAAASDVLPRPQLTVIKQTSVRGTPAVLVRSLRIVTSAGARYRVSCSHCSRVGKKKLATHNIKGGGRVYASANWVIKRKGVLVIRITAPNRIGWFFTIGISKAKRKPTLIYRHVSCIGPRGFNAPCGASADAPKVGQAVDASSSPPSTPPVPTTTISSGPSGTVTTSPVTFTYASSVRGATFECRLDVPTWTACAATGITYSAVADGNHTFSVRSTADGVVDAVPPTRQWLEQTPPRTTILSGPSGTVTSLPVTFTYGSSIANSTFECRLDAAAFAFCPADGASYSTVGFAEHVFSVRAIISGVTDAEPPTRSWTQAAPPPPPPPKPYAGNLRVVVYGGGHVGVAFDVGWQTGRDPVTCHFFRDGSEVFTAQCGTASSKQFYGVPAGTHSWHATVSDQFGVYSDPTNTVTVYSG